MTAETEEKFQLPPYIFSSSFPISIMHTTYLMVGYARKKVRLNRNPNLLLYSCSRILFRDLPQTKIFLVNISTRNRMVFNSALKKRLLFACAHARARIHTHTHTHAHHITSHHTHLSIFTLTNLSKYKDTFGRVSGTILSLASASPRRNLKADQKYYLPLSCSFSFAFLRQTLGIGSFASSECPESA